MNKMNKTICSLMLALVLCVSGVAAAFGAGPGLDDNGALLGTPSDPARAAISKIMLTPMGTALPAAEYEFAVSLVEVDGVKATASNTPQIDNVIVKLSDAKLQTTEDGIVTYVVESNDIFAGVDFPYAGVYEYQITEVANTYPHDPAHETVTYSDAIYTLTVYVKDSEAPATGTYIYAIGSRIDRADNAGQTGGGKVDPTPGGNGEDYTYSQMIFTNTYVKTNGSDPENPDPLNGSTLSISKKVSGTYASSQVYFDFTLDLSVPALIAPDTAYRAYVIENGHIVTSAANGAIAGNDDQGQPYLSVTAGSSLSFSLKDGQKLAFINTPVGTRYAVNEAGTAAYIPSFIIVTNGVAQPAVSGSMGASLATGDQYVGEAANSADYTNERDTVTPTGLNIDDLPFIGMIAIALVAATIGLVYKARRNSECDAAQVLYE